MNLKNIRVTIVLISMIATLALLLGAQLLYQKYYVEEPLFKLLQETRAVINMEFNQNLTQPFMELEFAEVENLKDSYNEIAKRTEQTLGHSVPIRIIDRRTPELVNVFDKCQFAIYEAIMNGSFTEMARVVEEQAGQAGLDRYAVYVDKDYVYLQFHKGGSYLYEVIPRDVERNAGGYEMGSEQL